jgi:adenine-specific DNA-methyltransferase
MTASIDKLETRRLALQVELDAHKSQVDRNRLGQFATPAALAADVLDYALHQLGDNASIRFLDPAIGTGSFYAALRAAASAPRRIERAVGLEIDQHYGAPAEQLWKATGLTYRLEDFTKAKPEPHFNLLICNPPYVRHHHLESDDKERLLGRTFEVSGMKLGGLAGLYCHFMGLAHGWMEDGGLAGWLIPSEFMNVNYGLAVKQYLLERVTLLHIHRFDPRDVQFADALVSSAIVWFRKTPPPKNHRVHFTFGGTLEHPHVRRDVPLRAMTKEQKWTRFPEATARSNTRSPVISDFFRIKRGLATGDNRYFILSREEIRARDLPMAVFRPILPSPRYLPDDKVRADCDGNPLLDRELFLLDINMNEHEVKEHYPTLHAYLEEGKQRALHERYLCRHRTPWYAQENRPAAPIVCTYLGRSDTTRKRPFRFILNRSMATAANVYLMMYPTGTLASALDEDPTLIERVWKALNAITPERLIGEGRVYGGGLHKLEPKELANVPVSDLAQLPVRRVRNSRIAAAISAA